MVDLMDLLRDVLVCSLQVWMLNDFGKNMFPYRVGSLWKRIGVYFAAALCIFIANHMGTTLFNITIIPVSYTIAAIIIFQGSKWKKVIMACCYYMLAIIPEFLFAAITEAYGVTGTANEFQSELEKTLAILLMKTMTFLLVKCINQITRKKNYLTIENKLFTVLLTLPIATIIIFMCIYYSHISFTGVNRIMIPIGAALLLMTNICIFAVFDKLIERSEEVKGVFKEHKADIVYQFPEKGTPLEMAGQTIYVVRFKENYICPDKNNMLDELERRIPEYMIPSVITFLPRLPQTSNDKIDRGRISKWISASAEENKKVDVAELPQNDLEEQIARIWCKELNIERIGRNDNFYLSGGDSLLIAQVIARMRETIEAAKRWSWDDLLKEMMKTPTIRGVAKILSNQAGENEQDKSLVIIKEAAESSEKKVTVVFHAGTGTLTPYNSLIAYITERSQENEAVMGFTFGDEAEYLAIPTDKIFENLGKKYGRILSELGFTEYTLIGHCVGGLIALETAHYLKDKGKNVSSVTLLSTSIPHKKEETVLADLDMKIFETAVQTSLYNELLLERTFASLIDADIKKAGHQVDNDTLQQVIEYLIFNNGGNITVQALCSLTGKFAEVGAEFQRLHSMSATERMNDLYTTIERPNGQLMEHQRKMLNVLFRVFAQNFRCVSSYIPKVYTGKMRVFDCESAIANFFPSLFSEDKKTWEQYAQGEFLFDTMKGDHISCMNSPYIEENVKKILDL